VAYIVVFEPLLRVVSLLDHFKGFDISFVVFSHGFDWDNGLKLMVQS
jgi:hypothetical protein